MGHFGYLARQFEEKNNSFHIFNGRRREGTSDIFVEWIKHYHNRKAHGNSIHIYQNGKLKMKTPEASMKGSYA